jgi:hypothetical protein
MSSKANLDALIPREDFYVSTEVTSAPTTSIKITDLELSAFFYGGIRKPDFQRETSEWDGAKICDFIESFINGDLIPAIILWQAGANTFVIDGAHRLSALISWVNDDYGDGKISREFFSSIIPKEQRDIADKTRKTIKKKVLEYKDYTFAVSNPDKSEAKIVTIAKKLGVLALQLQWVKGDAEIAEASFFKINQKAEPIDKTELSLLQSRKYPNALAARAIIRAGTGHKYWSLFSQEKQLEIERYARDITSLLFTPNYDTPIKTLDLPVAGKGYSSHTLPLIFDFVNIINDTPRNPKSDLKISIDEDGQETIRYLKACDDIVDRISGDYPGSLGLHPAIYFYSNTGRYHLTSFLAVVNLIKWMELTKYFYKFTTVRMRFENFLMTYNTFPNQIARKLGSGIKSYQRITLYYKVILELLLNGDDEETILTKVIEDPNFSFLLIEKNQAIWDGKDFDTDTKSAAYLRAALKTPLRCNICDGLIHLKSISIDHIDARRDGGKGTVDNAALTHPYCNTGFKEQRIAKGLPPSVASQ